MGISVFDHRSAAMAGTVFRRQRPGPEADLIAEFLENFPFDVPRGCHATVFCEPRIESGFPDLVVVFWSIATANKWKRERADVTQQDIRLVHHLHDSGPASTKQLAAMFTRRLSKSLERLEAAHLIRDDGKNWRPRPLADSFAVRRIIAIEAKVHDWADAVNQAYLNTWFASDSFVLLPTHKHKQHIRAAARSRGVRLCNPDDAVSCKRPAFPEKLPRSYASWLFNEWAWRFAQLRGGPLA